MHSRPQEPTFKTLLGALCLLLTAVIVLAGLWPFDFNPENRVERLPDGKGLRFTGRGLVYGREPLVVGEAGRGGTSVTIELVARPEEAGSNGVSSLLAFHDGSRPYRFMLGQWKRELIIRVPAGSGRGRKRFREIAADNALIRDTTAFITVTSSTERTDVFVNGKAAGHFPGYSLIPDGGGLSGLLLLGNAPDGNSPWRGSLTGLAVYDRALDDKTIEDHFKEWKRSGGLLVSEDLGPAALYLFERHDGRRTADRSGFHHDLLIPASFHPLQRRVLEMPEREQWFRGPNVIDVAVNILGFVPFGFLLAAWLRAGRDRSSLYVYGVTVLLGFFLSFAIEETQAYIPGRDSSLLDVISNTMGTALGGSLLIFFRLFPPSGVNGGRMP